MVSICLCLLFNVLQWKAHGLAGLPGLTAQPPVGVGTTSAQGPAPTQLRPAGRTSASGCTRRRLSATRTPAKVAASHPCSSWLPWWWEQGTAAKCYKTNQKHHQLRVFWPFSRCLLSQGKRRQSSVNCNASPFSLPVHWPLLWHSGAGQSKSFWWLIPSPMWKLTWQTKGVMRQWSVQGKGILPFCFTDSRSACAATQRIGFRSVLVLNYLCVFLIQCRLTPALRNLSKTLLAL